MHACRFKKGGRGWLNPLKAPKAGKGVASELKSPDQASLQLLFLVLSLCCISVPQETSHIVAACCDLCVLLQVRKQVKQKHKQQEQLHQHQDTAGKRKGGKKPRK